MDTESFLFGNASVQPTRRERYAKSLVYHRMFGIPNSLFRTPTLISAPNQWMGLILYQTHNLVFTDTHSYTVQRQFEFFTVGIKADGISIAKIVMATANVYSLFNMQEKK
jgi:hypothetical protein